MTDFSELMESASMKAVKAEVESAAEKLVTDSIFPIIRNVTAYKGAVDVKATATLSIVTTDGVATVHNDVALDLEFPKTFDVWEQAQQVIFKGLFVELLQRNAQTA